jgi:hypothetical protein
MSRVTLLAWRLKVHGQHAVDQFLDRTEAGSFLYYCFSLGRDSVADRLPHHPPVHAMLPG